MKQIMLTVAVVAAAGLASPAFAQGQTGGPPQNAAAQAPAEEAQPRTPEETLADHSHSFFARVQAREQAEDDPAADVDRQQEIRYYPAW